MIRTTVRMPENLFIEARKKAIDERMAFADIVNQALENYLRKPRMKQPAKFKLKVFSLGKAKSDLRRVQIYEHI